MSLPTILDLADQYQLDLEQRGNRYYCCCPFHEENTPSFSIDSEGRMFKCFGCGAGGGVLDFISLWEGIPREEVKKRYFGSREHPARSLGELQRKLQVCGSTSEPKRREILSLIQNATVKIDIAWRRWETERNTLQLQRMTGNYSEAFHNLFRQEQQWEIFWEEFEDQAGELLWRVSRGGVRRATRGGSHEDGNHNSYVGRHPVHDNSKGHRIHLKLNTLITIILAVVVVILTSAVLTLFKKMGKFEISQRVDPIRMRSIVMRINKVNPKVPKGEALEYARVIASQQQYMQPVAMAILEREHIPGYDMHTDGAAGEKGGMQLLPGTMKALTRWTPYTEKELAFTIEGNIVGGLTWWQMHYASYGDISKGSSGYNGIPDRKIFPTAYGRDIAMRVRVISMWIDSVDAVQLHAFKPQTR